MRRWHRWIEQGVTGPHLRNAVDAQMRVLEQVGHLSVDLERPLIAKQFKVEAFTARHEECNTNGYDLERTAGGDT